MSKASNHVDASFLTEVEDYLYMQDDLVDNLTGWARNNCSSFTDKDPRCIEQPLEHTELHHEFCDIFENMLTKFLISHDVSITEFYSLLKQEQKLAESGKAELPVSATFGSMLLSVTDFFSFCEMMYDVNSGGEVVFCPPLIDDANRVAGAKCESSDDDDCNYKSSKK